MKSNLFGVCLLAGVMSPAAAWAGQVPSSTEPAAAEPAEAAAPEVAPEGPALAEPAAASGGYEASVATTAPEGTVTPAAAAPTGPRERWIRRYRPRRNSFELGVFAGVFFPSSSHELFDPVLQLESGNTFFKPYKSVAPEFGARFAYFPLTFLGVEAEGGAMPTRVEGAGDGFDRATLFNFRAHAVAQLPFWSVAPFIVVGPGLIGTAGALGDDVDPSVHFGGGVKVFLNDWVLLRLDIRDVIAARLMVDAGATHYPEVLLGLSMRFGGRDRGEKDSDGDGYLDSQDGCPYDPENFNGFEDEDGCPEYDRDGDGFFDSRDLCPDTPGVEPHGCPEKDSDGDGILDSKDLCPDIAGVPPDGCPVPDTDGDGYLDPDDGCPTIPETWNGYLDEDGCDDTLPERVPVGVIRGIFFDFNKATIKDRSRPVLDRAVEVFNEFTSIRVEISGHTDDKGSSEYNQKLSMERANSVKQYLVDHGVAASR
ncbi:MAG: OmpA family protein, partial [Myxococcales bacterium]|nr:OmpA family protein [Myxococcales bacterium]